SIVDVVQSYLPLKKAGRNMTALCPFHTEKTPSFMVNPSLGIFKCFGCGESGDIFHFIEKIDGVSFGEALETLAQKAGVTLTRSKQEHEETDRRSLLYTLNDLIADLFHFFLMKSDAGKKARQYAEERQLTPETLIRFKLGYAPDSWDTLVQFLQKKGYTLGTAEQLGLIIKGDKGYYDRFRDRLMFPVFDPKGRVAGFSGRTLKPDFQGAKYMNSPDSEVFHKGQLLYGIHVASGQARLEEEMILVEGNVDVMRLHQEKFTNTVAPLGTALTPEQLRLIRRSCSRIFLAFDPDSAGIKATLRSLELAENEGLDVRVIRLPEGKDPDLCVREDLGCWLQAKNAALPVLEYQLERILKENDLTTSLGRSAAARASLVLIMRLSSRVSQVFYLEQLAGKLGVAVEVLMEEAKKNAFRTESASPSVAPVHTPVDPTELEVLRVILAHPDYRSTLQDFSDNWFSDPQVGAIIAALRCQAGQVFKLDSFYATLPDMQQEIVRGIAMRGEIDSQAEPADILDAPAGPGDLRLPLVSEKEDFVSCIRSRRPTVADAEIGHRTTTICQLGVIAIDTGRRIRWDPAAERIIGDEETARHLSRPMREPW
ncbi:MAG TPA: DNA primase, partial [bacterium]|nr:DNA primase [bacterium]